MIRFFIVIMFSCLAVTSCGIGGTETGNPQPGAQEEGGDTGGDSGGDSGDDSPSGGDEMGDNEPQGAAAASSAEQILNSLCSKLVSCYETLTDTNCKSGMLEASNIDSELGLNEGAYTSYQAIIDAEVVGEIIVDTRSVAQCQTDIEALTCTDPSVVAAFDPDDADNFNDVFRMIPNGSDSCEGVYGE